MAIPTPEEILAGLATCNCISDMTFKQDVLAFLGASYSGSPGSLVPSSATGSNNTVDLMGVNAAITTTAETVWSPSSVYAQLTTAVAMEAVSSSVADDSAGTGARTIEVDLIDGNYEASTVTVIMDGTTPVAITGTFLAVNDVRILTAGSSLTNVGNIDIRVVAGSAIKYRMSLDATAVPGNNSKSQFLYTVPAGYWGILSPVSWSAVGVTGELTASVRTYDSTGIFKTIGASRVSFSSTALTDGQGVIPLGKGALIPESTLIEGRVFTSAGVGVFGMQSQLVLIAQPS